MDLDLDTMADAEDGGVSNLLDESKGIKQNKEKLYKDELHNINLAHLVVCILHAMWCLIFAVFVGTLPEVTKVHTYLVKSAWYSQQPIVDEQGEASLGSVPVAYHLLAALFHAVFYFKLWNYDAKVISRINTLRWVQYCITHCIASAYLAIVCGVNETRVIGACSILGFVQYAFLYFSDNYEKPVAPFVFSAITLLFKWGFLSSSLFSADAHVPVSAVVAWSVCLFFEIVIFAGQVMSVTGKACSSRIPHPFRDSFDWGHATTGEMWFIIFDIFYHTFLTWSTMVLML